MLIDCTQDEENFWPKKFMTVEKMKNNNLTLNTLFKN